MNIDKPTRTTRGEGVIRGILGFILIAAVVCALTNGNGESQGFGIAWLSSL